MNKESSKKKLTKSLKSNNQTSQTSQPSLNNKIILIHSIKLFLIIFLITTFSIKNLNAKKLVVPQELKGWKEWVMWDQEEQICPRNYKNSERICVWTSSLNIQAKDTDAKWNFKIRVYKPSWITLPGSKNHWPQNVTITNKPTAITEKNDIPMIFLKEGDYSISGEFIWNKIPQYILIPKEIGIITLNINGKKIENIQHDQQNKLWLKRINNIGIQEDHMFIKIYRLLEDGIPMKLHTEIELNVSGKSREETLGNILPDNWTISNLSSPIQVALNNNGLIKAQVRPGTWTISITAFKNDKVSKFSYPKNIKPILAKEFIALKSDPTLRVIKIKGMENIDASQTTFPKKWQKYPVYIWNTNKEFNIIEENIGSLKSISSGLIIRREFWLNEKNKEFIYKDYLTGETDDRWRLNVAKKHKLGAVKINNVGQLITYSPPLNDLRKNNSEKSNKNEPSTGVEIRTKKIKMHATGSIKDINKFPATGWQTNLRKAKLYFNLPPGWRVLALLGADGSKGDWLMSWSLLDIFLLLLFTIILFNLWNVKVAIIGFITFALCYHEPYALRYLWFLLLIFIALLKNVDHKLAVKILKIFYSFIIISIAFCLIAFLTYQIQTLMYPQLEKSGIAFSGRSFFKTFDGYSPNAGLNRRGIIDQDKKYKNNSDPFLKEGILLDADSEHLGQEYRGNKELKDLNRVSNQNILSSYSRRSSNRPQSIRITTPKKIYSDTSNLNYSSKTKIQTGPAIPNWNWNTALCWWDSPLSTKDNVRVVLLSLTQWRIISIIRLIFLFLLLASVFNVNLSKLKMLNLFNNKIAKNSSAASIAIFLFLTLVFSSNLLASKKNNIPIRDKSQIKDKSQVAIIPDQTLLNELKKRLIQQKNKQLEEDFLDGNTKSAIITQANLDIIDDKVKMKLKIHALINSAVPIPANFSAWSPISINSIDGNRLPMIKKNNFLWISLEKGIHTIIVEGLVNSDINGDEFEMNFLLKPKFVTITANDWEIIGVKKNIITEQQIIFKRKKKNTDDKLIFENNRVLNSIATLERNLEIGLKWKIKNIIKKITPNGKAITLKVKLLKGEKILSNNLEEKNGFVQVSLSANESLKTWDSIIESTPQITFNATRNNYLVEQWKLFLSPIWNINYKGQEPFFEPHNTQLQPIWRPWPGDKLELNISRPKALIAETITINEVKQKIGLGKRLSTYKLELNVESSISEEFIIQLPKKALKIEKKRNNKIDYSNIEDNLLKIQLQPGKQNLAITWEIPTKLKNFTKIQPVKLPYKMANVSTIVTYPKNRWLLKTFGPTIGPSIRLWSALSFLVIFTFVLANLKLSPLKKLEWLILSFGLTQINKYSAVFIILWFFLIAWRGQYDFKKWNLFLFNLLQLFIIILTIIFISILISIVETGLLGSPAINIIGNGSYNNFLKWFSPYEENYITQPKLISLSIWYYRFFMLLWALWLASRLIIWSKWSWKQFGHQHFFKKIARNNNSK